MLRRILTLCAALALTCNLAAAHEWNSFSWAPAKSAGLDTDKGAILIPVKIDDHTFLMQLDTGAGTSILYRYALPRDYFSSLDKDVLTIQKFSFGTQSSTRRFSLMYSQQAIKPGDACIKSDESNLVGTMGDDALLNGSVSLDLANNRYYFQRGPYLPSEPVNAKTAEIVLEAVDGLVPTVSLILPDGSSKAMLFDTGSAVSNIDIFHESDWLQLVGLQRPEQAQSYQAPRWGHEMIVYRAPIRSDIHLGTITMPKGTLASYGKDNIVPMENRPEFGSIGLSFFSNNVVTLDYASKKLFIEPSPPQGGKSQVSIDDNSKKIDMTAMREYIGTYTLNNDRPVKIDDDGDTLAIRVGDDPAVNAYQTQPDTFVTNPPFSAQVTFQRDDKKKIVSLIVHSNCRDVALANKEKLD